MSTTKKRIFVSLPDAASESLAHLAQRDQMPEATKASELLQLALDIEEDRYLGQVARSRDSKKVRWVSHAALWNKKATR